MEALLSKFNMYMIPPALSLFVGLSLAVLFLVKGKFKKDNVLFALLCIWWSLLAPIFLSHHLFRGDIDKLLKIERTVHFVYVFLPLINLIYFHNLYKIRRNYLIYTGIVLSSIFAITTQTPYYIRGLYTYDWGYMAKGGIAFQLFGLYGFLVVIYFIVVFFRMLRNETDYLNRLRLKYIAISFNIVTYLTLLNIPSMNGFDFYPMGNFMFLPLIVLAYGIFRYRLLDIQTVIYMTFIWAVFSSFFIIPNIFLFILIKPYFTGLPDYIQFPILGAWFFANHFYLLKVQPVIDQFFNKRKYNLRLAFAQFVENISFLRTLNELVNELIDLLKRTLILPWAGVFIRERSSKDYVDRKGKRIAYNEDIEEWFLGATHLAEKSLVERDPYFISARESLLKLFSDLQCEYIMPLTHNNELIALLAMPGKQNFKALTTMEIKFINNIISTVSISLANSMMYQELAVIKDNLEDMVEDRTAELQAINETLTTTNSELEVAQNTARMDMEMARYVQSSLFQMEPPVTAEYEIAMVFRPMAGVSGDLYDFYEKDGRLRGLALFDVSGHGIASGLITMIARSIFRRHFFNMEMENLNSVIEKANLDFIKETENVDNYLTGIILRFTPDGVEYVNGGHPDIFYKSIDTKRVIKVNKKTHDFKGMFLGSLEMHKPFEIMKFKFTPGDMLLLYTDCLVEGKNKDKHEYGEARLSDSFYRAPSESAQSALDFIMEDFKSHTAGRPLDDDLTAIIVKKIL